MTFAHKVWRLLVGVKDGLALIALLLFFFALYTVLTFRPGAGEVRKGALLLKLDGALVEEASRRSPLDLIKPGGAPTAQFQTRDVVHALDTAAKDDRVKAVVLDLSRFTGGGLTSTEEVAAALDRFRAAKKPVLTFAVGYLDDGVMLAAHSSEVWVDPLGGAFVAGPGGNRLYYGKLLDYLKVNVHVFRVGTYKDYVEPYLLNQQSPASKESTRALYGAVWDNWLANVKKARPQADLARVTSDPVGWLKAAGGNAAEASKAAGLVDRVGDKVDFGKRVAQIVGEDSRDPLPGHYPHSTLRAWLADNPVKTPGRAIPVVTVAGEIVDGKAGPGSAGGDRIARLIDEATADKRAPALVLRVDSPGGSVLASEAIRTALVRFKATRRPVVVSMGDLAASGGYWVSTPGERIFAEPGTITGSIGIFAIVPSFEKALGAWGVNGDGVRTTPLSGQPDLLTGLTPEVEAMLQANIESGYARFVGLVAQSRHKTPAEIDTIAQGRVWDGGTARQIGLVDQFGGLDDALAYAANRAGLKQGGWHPDFLGADANPYASLIERWRDSDNDGGDDGAQDFVALIANREQARLGAALAGVERLFGRPGAQAYCLQCGPVARTAPSSPFSLSARLAAAVGLI